MREAMPDLHGFHAQDGAGHWLQQKRRNEVNRLLIDFLSWARRALRWPLYGFPVCGNCPAASSKVRTASSGSLPAAATFRAL